MGHVRLGVLPASQKWRQVIDQLRLGADAELIAAAVAHAAEASLKRASYDPAFLHSFWLLFHSQRGALRSRKNCVALVCRCPTNPASWT
jgi:hypothetical protein